MPYHINAPRIAFEQIEDETIVIDFDSGTYFSTGPAGSEILRLAAQGRSPEEIAAGVAQRFAGEPGEIDREVRRFLAELAAESILLEGARDPASAPPAAEPPVPSAPARFESPRLQKFTDMKDLLLLDPIHEVDPEGWPIQKSDG